VGGFTAEITEHAEASAISVCSVVRWILVDVAIVAGVLLYRT